MVLILLGEIWNLRNLEVVMSLHMGSRNIARKLILVLASMAITVFAWGQHKQESKAPAQHASRPSGPSHASQPSGPSHGAAPSRPSGPSREAAPSRPSAPSRSAGPSQGNRQDRSTGARPGGTGGDRPTGNA